jgi:hypothetical protein
MYPPQYPQQRPPEPYPDHMSSAYPGMLPPPVQYPKKRRWPLIAGGALALVVVVGLIAAMIALGSRDGDNAPAGALSDAAAKTAIQDYLDAMSNGDDETVARHTLCGMFDAVKERRSDLALAGLSADAFRKQYDTAEVTSIDKMVMWSPHQAQVLFTMKVTPASSSRDRSSDEEQQAVAQILSQGDEVLVCSYLPRTAGQY